MPRRARSTRRFSRRFPSIPARCSGSPSTSSTPASSTPRGRTSSARLPARAAQALPAQPIWLALARAHLARGDAAAARRACERALELVPDALPSLRLLAWLLLEGGDAPRGADRLPARPFAPPARRRAHASARQGAEGGRRVAEARTRAGRMRGDRPATTPAVLTTLGAVCLEPATRRRRGGISSASIAADAARRARRGTTSASRAGCWGTTSEALAAFEKRGRGAIRRSRPRWRTSCTRSTICAPGTGSTESERRLIATLDAPGERSRAGRRSSRCDAADAGAAARGRAPLVARDAAAAVAPRRRAAARQALARRLPVRRLSRASDRRLMAGLFEEHDRSASRSTRTATGPTTAARCTRGSAPPSSIWRDVRDVAGRGSGADDPRRRHRRADRAQGPHARRPARRSSRVAPAPVQIHYMSFPGTMGYDAVDGMIADAEVVPPGSRSRSITSASGGCRAAITSTTARRALPPPARAADAGLPEDALVLACLNQSYKLSPRRSSPSGWRRCARAPDAVLWLLARGVRGARPICAPRPRGRRRSGARSCSRRRCRRRRTSRACAAPTWRSTRCP